MAHSHYTFSYTFPHRDGVYAIRTRIRSQARDFKFDARSLPQERAAILEETLEPIVWNETMLAKRWKDLIASTIAAFLCALVIRYAWRDIARLWHTPITYGWFLILGIPSLLYRLFRIASMFFSWKREREEVAEKLVEGKTAKIYCTEKGHCPVCRNQESKFCCVCMQSFGGVH